MPISRASWFPIFLRDNAGHIVVHPGGWPRMRGDWAQRVVDSYHVIFGGYSLHRAWQQGYDDHIREESARRARGGN